VQITSLKDLDDKVLSFGDKLGEVAAAGRRVQKLERELEKELGLLARTKALLDEDRATYQVAGRGYSRAQVNADGLARLAQCEQTGRQLARQLAEAVAEARNNLARAQLVRQQKAALEARLANADLLAQVNDLTRDLKTAPLGPQTELAQKLEAFERRVTSVERRASLTAAEARGGAVIDFEGGPPEAGPAIARCLNGDPEKGSR
jgi:hypothetical protein